MKNTFLLGLTFFIMGLYNITHALTYPYDTRSDSIDIIHYTLKLDITDFANSTIKGEAVITLHPLVNGIQQIKLDLKGLQVDSVKSDNSTCTFNHTGESIYIQLPTIVNFHDTIDLAVYYKGAPVHDPSFGGFYFSGNYAYSVGVSLSEIPHNYGRTWFPCLDNFIDRSTYDLLITVSDTKKAIGSGLLQSVTPLGNGTSTWHWKCSESIPTYLISIAVADYQFLTDQYTSITNTNIPVILAARASDTIKVKNSFANLENAFHIYEDKYGPYRWQRIGYAFVPMTAGAMEHAMNIAYPVGLADNTLNYQDIMAHELSHHWWGNLVTCRTAEDMWINEGMASYSEFIFNEDLYGNATYRSMVRTNHKKNLHKAHINDGGYWPLSGIPQQHTYSSTTYNKGADIIHTLRSYLFDSLFFSGLDSLLTLNQYQDIDAWEFRDDLSQITGKDLTSFFNDWILQGGWPFFGIDSVSTQQAGPNTNAKVYFRQKLTGRSFYSEHVPVEIQFFDAQWNSHTVSAELNGWRDTISFTLPFQPVFTIIDPFEKLSHAVTAHTSTIKTTGTHGMTHANFTLNVQQISDSVLFRVEQHWTGADQLVPANSNWTVSPQRYWKVDGIWNAGFSAKANLYYNGRTSGNNSHLDHLLIGPTEDSLIVVYRPSSGAIWTEWPYYTKTTGANTTDKVGTIEISQLAKGEYAYAYKGLPTGIEEETVKPYRVFPNPSSNQWTIEWNEQVTASPDNIILSDVSGKIISQLKWNENSASIDASALSNGIYYLSFVKNKKMMFSHKLIKTK